MRRLPSDAQGRIGKFSQIPYYLDPATDFQTYLGRYLDAAQSRRASVVFVTPTPKLCALPPAATAPRTLRA